MTACRLMLCLALSACQPAADDSATPSAGPAAATAPSMPAPTPDKTPIPTRLTKADLAAAALPGELACNFADTDRRLLLIAKGNVDTAAPAAAMIKVGATLTRLSAPGGFDAIVKGARFTGNGTIAKIEATGPATGGGESPPLPATLTIERAGAAPFVASGDWTCGP